MPDPERGPASEPSASEAFSEAFNDDNDEPVYVISVAARLAGLPAWTLRVLDKEGIVCPQRTEKDRRLYSNRDIERLARVRYLSEERGVNMNGVKVILEMEDSPPRRAKASGPAGQKSGQTSGPAGQGDTK